MPVVRPALRLLAVRKGDISATDDDLEHAGDLWESIEDFFARVVILGVALEFLVAFLIATLNDRGGSLALWGPLIGDAYVAIGLALEIVAGRRAKGLQRVLVERSNNRLAEATERAAKAERDAEKLRAVTAWRALDEKQHKTLAIALRASGPGASLQIAVVMNDQESLNFAQRISIPFKAAGWIVGLRFNSFTSGIMTGILLPEIDHNHLDEVKAVNARVRDAFIAAEIPFVNGWPPSPIMSTVDNTPLSAPIAVAYVGPKPMPML